MNRFQRKLHNHHVPLTRGPFETLQINIGWRGEVFDCDFNQMLRMQQRNGKPLFLWDISPESMTALPILTADHCLGCTAGRGSSCGSPC